MADAGIQVVVRFPDAVPHDAQGRALLAMEKHLRELTRMDIRVVKDLQGDDSRLRRTMTIQARAKL